MKSNQQKTDSSGGQDKNKGSKGIVILLVIIVMGLAAAVGVMLSKLNDQKEEMEQQKKDSAEIQELLESQKQLLEDDLIDLQGQFGALRTDNDSLMNLASEQQERITRLLAVQRDNANKIKLYQQELETLRGVLRSYIVQVDSLNQSNIALRAERTELNRNLAAERVQSARLSADLERQTTTVQRAQVLSASDIRTIGLNNRNNETPRVRNIVKLQTCFTVRDNPVAPAGPRAIYIVIIKPDKQALTNRENASFRTSEGADIIYTERRRDVDYDNKDIEVCIFTDNNNRLTEGNYETRIYCDGYLIGTSNFVLR